MPTYSKPPKTQNKIIMMHAMKKLTSPLKVADIGKISLGKYTLLTIPALFLYFPSLSHYCCKEIPWDNTTN